MVIIRANVQLHAINAWPVAQEDRAWRFTADSRHHQLSYSCFEFSIAVAER